ncbi:MAG: hypothetical protein R2780_13410 [Crocinitomicaceae bacterium]|nr:hypothetical protein [Crocinitomicaceae bacterium]
MNKFLFYLLPCFIIVSCNSSNETDQNNNVANNTEIAEPVLDTVFYEDEITEPELNVDSMAQLYNDMEQSYMDHHFLLEDARSDLYSMSRESFGVYHSGTEIWYFDEEFNLVYYTNSFGAEGGYELEVLGRVTNDIPWLIAIEENDGFDPVKTFFRYNDDGSLKYCAGAKVSYETNEKTFIVPTNDDYDYSYKKYLKEQKASDFTPGSDYNYENSKMVDSEYGGQEKSGYIMSIDSLLFRKLYKL